MLTSCYGVLSIPSGGGRYGFNASHSALRVNSGGKLASHQQSSDCQTVLQLHVSEIAPPSNSDQ